MSPVPLHPPVSAPAVLQTTTWRGDADGPLGPAVAVEGGRLVLRGQGPASITGHAITAAAMRDVIVDTVVCADGVAPGEGFGVFVRQSATTRYIAWRMTIDGVIVVSAMDGTESPLAAGTLAEGMVLHTGAGAANRFTVVASGPALTLVLNDLVVTSVLIDQRFVDGHAGVVLEQRRVDSAPSLAVEWFEVRALLPGD